MGTEQQRKTSNFLIIFINIVLAFSIIAVFYFTSANFRTKLREQNINDITNINQSAANISSSFFQNQQKRLADSIKYISQQNDTLNEALLYINNSNSDSETNYELIGTDGRGYATVSAGTGFVSVNYTSIDYSDLQKIFAATDKDSTKIRCTPEFTDQYTASKSFALYQHLQLSGTSYTLMSIYKSSDFAGLIELDSGYEDLATVLINQKGDYILGSTRFKSNNLFHYFYDYSGLSLDQRNEEAEAFADGTKKIFYFKDSDARDCVYVTAAVQNTDWYSVTCVPISSFHASSMDLRSIIYITVLLLGLMMFNVIWLNHVNRQLRTSVARETEASAAKTDFLSRMSHDIRTPLNVINGSVLLAQKEKNSETTAKYLNHIDQSSKYLSSLVNDILDLNKVEQGKMELHPEPYSLKQLNNSLTAIISPLCSDKGLSFQTRGLNSDENYLLDPVRTSQIFFNLLSNSVKFTPAGGHIGLDCTSSRSENGKTKLSFKAYDDGIGMSEEFQQHMFEAFSQENQNTNLSLHGTGLGLAIVHNLVKLMGGTVKVQSELNQGTIFYITLEAEKAGATAAEEKQKASLEILINKRALLCEDNQINAEIATTMLKEKGMIITHAADGAKGVELFKASKENEFDIILMDMKMPVMDGITATKTIRALSRSDAKTIPILAMTANAYDSDVKVCMDAGMNGHISKPIDPEIMYQSIADHLKQKK